MELVKEQVPYLTYSPCVDFKRTAPSVGSVGNFSVYTFLEGKKHIFKGVNVAKEI